MKDKCACIDTDIRAFRAALRTMVRKINRQLKEDTSCCGVGFLPCHILMELDGKNGLSLRGLQKEMETDKAGLSRAVDSLVKDGLVTRKENAEDRRNIVIELTAAGRKKVGDIHRHCDRKYRKLFDLIPEKEHAAVVRAVSYLARAFDDLSTETMCCLPEKKETKA